jgi:hypothetical protein
MPFAIFYNREDLTPIAAEVGRADIPPGDKQIAQKLWNGGLKNWNTAPLAPPDRNSGDPDCRILVVDSTVSLAEFRLFLRRMAASNPGAEYLNALADDMMGESGAVEPWPPV